MQRATSPLQVAKLPAWLPQPLRTSYIGTVSSELSNREEARSDLRVPKSDLAEQYPSIAAAYNTSVGLSLPNIRFNRYTDVVPYDRSRVSLPGGEYVNASWVKELNGGKWTIATQAPLDKTAHSFLSLFLNPLRPPSQQSAPPPAANRLRTIVQLTPNVEGRLAKATPYFPKTVGEEMTWPAPVLAAAEVSIPPIKVKLLQTAAEGDAWIHSILELSYENAGSPSHLVRHLHYLGWPDHGVPRDVRGLLQFIKFVEACNTDKTHADAAVNPDPPIVIGCSAGVGRTGTFIALASILRAYGLNRPEGPSSSSRQDATPLADWSGTGPGPSPLGPLPANIAQDEIALEVDNLREQRPMMVQTDKQLQFIYQVFQAAMELEAKVRSE